MRALFCVLITTLAMTASADAGKPTPAPGTSSPEVVYIYTAKNRYEVRVSNEDGTGAVTLYTAPNYVIAEFGPRVTQTIYIWDGPALKRLTYSTSTGVVRAEAIETIIPSSGMIGTPQFSISPGGSLVAWASEGDRKLRVHNVETGVETILTELDGWAGDVTFDHSGNTIFYTMILDQPDRPYAFRSIPTAGGVSQDVEIGGIDGINQRVIDADGSGIDAGMLLTIQIPQDRRYLAYYSGGQLTELTTGWNGSLKCDNSRAMYELQQKRGWATHIYNLNTGQTSTFSNDTNVRRAKYMPDC